MMSRTGRTLNERCFLMTLLLIACFHTYHIVTLKRKPYTLYHQCLKTIFSPGSRLHPLRQLSFFTEGSKCLQLSCLLACCLPIEFQQLDSLLLFYPLFCAQVDNISAGVISLPTLQVFCVCLGIHSHKLETPPQNNPISSLSIPSSWGNG